MAARGDFHRLLEELGQSHTELEEENGSLRREVERLRRQLRERPLPPKLDVVVDDDDDDDARQELRTTAGATNGAHLSPPDLPAVPTILPGADDESDSPVPQIMSSQKETPVQTMSVHKEDCGQKQVTFNAHSKKEEGHHHSGGLLKKPMLMRATTSYHESEDRLADKRARRFRELFNKRPYQQRSHKVTSDDLLPVLEARGMQNLSREKVDDWLAEILRVVDKGTWDDRLLSNHSSATAATTGSRMSGSSVAVRFEDFVAAMHNPALCRLVSAGAKGIRKMQTVLLKQDVDEVIARAARRGIARQNTEELQDHGVRRPWFMDSHRMLNYIVTLAVAVSLACLLLSPDNDPSHWSWFVIELGCTLVFVVEIAVRHRWEGFRQYWRGKDRYWNYLDAGITLIAITDVVTEAALTNGSNISVVLVLRSLRALRLARALKMLRSPLVQELSNMLIGFLIGMPALFWTIFLLSIIVIFVGLCFRLTVGPTYGNPKRIPTCGLGDDRLDWEEEEGCEPHFLYSEEYCGSVMGCSFTIFRCVIGDCTSRGGQSLPAHLSHGFGATFEVTYILGMIIIIFGLFNVITAIFVEATMQGLKYNETKQRLESKYKSMYVEKMLRKLVKRIETIYYEGKSAKSALDGEDSRALTPADDSGLETQHLGTSFGTTSSQRDISLNEEEFFWVAEDSGVRNILLELDVELEGAAFDTLFETMDTSGDGCVSLSEMIDCFMKLRGGPMKVDMIAPWVAIRSLKRDVEILSQTVDKQGLTPVHK